MPLANGSIWEQDEGESESATGRVAEVASDDEVVCLVIWGGREQPAANTSEVKVAALENRRQNLGIARSRKSNIPSSILAAYLVPNLSFRGGGKPPPASEPVLWLGATGLLVCLG